MERILFFQGVIEMYDSFVLMHNVTRGLNSGDEVVICDLAGEYMTRGLVLRSEKNYMGIEGLVKILFQAYDDSLNTEYDDVTKEYYFTIVDQYVYH